MNSKKLAPIALFVYNRPDHLRKTIKFLSNNIFSKNSELYIFSDYAKNQAEIEAVNQVRKICFKIKNFKKVNLINRPYNYGLAKNIERGTSYILKYHDKVIVLEDDLLTDKYFLKYMNFYLEKFKNYKNIISIHGYLYPIKKNLTKPFFLKGADCWGWATWKRGWKIYEKNTSLLIKKISNKKKINEFNFYNTYNYFRLLKKNQKNFKSWAVNWYASAFLKNKLTLYPPYSLVKNIGNDGSGINNPKTQKYNVKLKNKNIKKYSLKIVEDTLVKKEIAKYFISKNNFIKKLYFKFIL